MDIEKMAQRVAAVSDGPVKVDHSIYDNTDVSVEELLDAVESLPSGHLWVKMTGFGWLAVNKDPSTLSEDTPVEGGPVWSSGPEDTWGKVMANEYVADVSDKPFVEYSSSGALMADEDFIRFICSYDDDNREELADLLRERGSPQQADFVSSVEM